MLGSPSRISGWYSGTYRLTLSYCTHPLMLKMCIIVLYYLNTLLRTYYYFEFFLKNRRESRIYTLLLHNLRSSAIVATGICSKEHGLTDVLVAVSAGREGQSLKTPNRSQVK